MLLRLEAWRKPPKRVSSVRQALQPNASDHVRLHHGALFARCNYCRCTALKVAKVVNCAPMNVCTFVQVVNQTIRKEYAECGHSTAELQASEVAVAGSKIVPCGRQPEAKVSFDMVIQAAEGACAHSESFSNVWPLNFLGLLAVRRSASMLDPRSINRG